MRRAHERGLSVRWRLTLVYSLISVLSATVLLSVVYVLVSQTQDDTFFMGIAVEAGPTPAREARGPVRSTPVPGPGGEQGLPGAGQRAHRRRRRHARPACCGGRAIGLVLTAAVSVGVGWVSPAGCWRRCTRSPAGPGPSPRTRWTSACPGRPARRAAGAGRHLRLPAGPHPPGVRRRAAAGRDDVPRAAHAAGQPAGGARRRAVEPDGEGSGAARRRGGGAGPEPPCGPDHRVAAHAGAGPVRAASKPEHEPVDLDVVVSEAVARSRHRRPGLARRARAGDRVRGCRAPGARGHQPRAERGRAQRGRRQRRRTSLRGARHRAAGRGELRAPDQPRGGRRADPAVPARRHRPDVLRPGRRPRAVHRPGGRRPPRRPAGADPAGVRRAGRGARRCLSVERANERSAPATRVLG